MDQWLSARQVQELLLVDRTTVYRMLHDGRLTGVKVGEHWRFERRAVQALLTRPGERPPDDSPFASSASSPDADSPVGSAGALPVHCVQAIQDVFAEIAGVGALTVGPSGEHLTEISNSCRFCDLILSTPVGRAACGASWKALLAKQDWPIGLGTCHAGLSYAGARIEVGGGRIPVLVAGQFYRSEPSRDEETTRVQRLAETLLIEATELSKAALDIPRPAERTLANLGAWLRKVAEMLAEVSHERRDLFDRLHRIAAMSTLDRM